MAYNEFMRLLDEPVASQSEEAALKAVAHLYHAYFTGLILHVALKAGEETAGNWSFRVFRRLHHEKFLSSFEKLGLSSDTHPVAAAKYHYLSNSVGGVEVEFMPESETKAWVRFCHSRWLYDGTALCGVPESVSHGFLKGWYGHNGVSLGNDRMGFVCVSQDMTAEIGLSGYFKVFDHVLEEHERLQFSPGEQPPPFDLDKAPKLDASVWPRLRLLKANRNYAMDYVRVGLIELENELGVDKATEISGHAAALIGRQLYRDLQRHMGFDRDAEDTESFVHFFRRLTQASGDSVNQSGLSQSGWRLMNGESTVSSSTFSAWARLWEGMASVHNRFLAFNLVQGFETASQSDANFEWRFVWRRV